MRFTKYITINSIIFFSLDMLVYVLYTIQYKMQTNNVNKKMITGQCRNFTCSRPNCSLIGNFQDGSMKQYSVGPKKDAMTMKFCGHDCWKKFTWSMMDYYNKYPQTFPPTNYPIEIKNSCIEWKRRGYMEGARDQWIVEESHKKWIQAEMHATRTMRNEQYEREGQNVLEENDDDDSVFYTNN
jgi:hypothetical protein